jgi:hypothetical protein
MFIEADGLFQWECDDCNRTVEFPADDFWSRWGDLKARGWIAHFERDSEGAGWMHRCSNCRKTAAEILNMRFGDRRPKEVKG